LRFLEIVGCADIPVSIIKKEITTHSGWSRTATNAGVTVDGRILIVLRKVNGK